MKRISSVNTRRPRAPSRTMTSSTWFPKDGVVSVSYGSLSYPEICWYRFYGLCTNAWQIKRDSLVESFLDQSPPIS